MNGTTSPGTLAVDLCTDSDRVRAFQITVATFHDIFTTSLSLTKVSEIFWKFQPILVSPIRSFINKY